jgi:hypothetical protein
MGVDVFVGLIVGAFIAYCSDWIKEWRRRCDGEHAAVMRSQLALIAQSNTINNLREQYLDKLRTAPDREAKLIRFDMEDSHLRVDYNSIAFLLKKHA